MPAFSVIMSVYNHERYVEDAVRSVRGQTFEDWELILVNDGSRDRSAELIDGFARQDTRIQPIHQANQGAAAARNRAIQAACGANITYLDSDDIWFPHTLQTYADYLRTHESARFLFGYAHRLRAKTITELPPPKTPSPAGCVDLFQRMFLLPLAVCHHRSIWDMTHGFDPRLRWCEDYDLFLRMSLHVALEPLGIPLGLRRRHDSNVSQRSGQSQVAEAEVLERFAREVPDVIPAKLRNRRVAQVLARAARLYFVERNYAECFAASKRAQELAPTMRVGLLSWLSGRFAPRQAA